MLEIGVTFDQAGKSLGLVGRTGEDSARVIVCDCAQVLEEYPGAEIVCAMRRACDAEAYAHTLTADGSAHRAVLTAADVAAPGSLMIEFRAVRDGQVLKSAVYVGRVERGLAGQTAAPGNPVADVIDRLNAQAEAARKAADAAQQMADEVRRKLEAGELNGSDAEVTAENIQSALGYAPVKDVQLAGKSLLDGGVAHVPVASKVALGVSSVDNYSIGTTNTGVLFLYNSRNVDINNRSANIALTPYNLDYAVTAAMTDGKGPAWTAAQRAAARDRIGIPGDYELIEEIVLTEESRVARSKEPDGAPYNFATIMTRAEFPASDKTGNIYISYNIGNEYNNIISYFLSPYKADAVKYGYSKVWVENSRYRSGWWTCVENHGQFAQYYENPMQQDKYSIADGNIIGFSTDVMAAGTKIKIYGVRA